MSEPLEHRQSAPHRLWFVVPMYYDVESFVRLRKEIYVELDRADVPYERVTFVVVDDSAGADPDVESLREYEDIQLLTPPFNLGHQRAIVFGLRATKHRFRAADYIITMDSDGEDRPQDVVELLRVLRTRVGRLDAVVIARRTKRTEPMLFRFLYAGFLVLFRVLTGTTIRSGNFAALRGDFVRSAIDHPSFDLCYSSSLVKLNPQRIDVPCPRGTRFAGHSRMGIQGLLIHGIRMMLPFADRIAVRSLVFFATALVTTIVAAFALLVSTLAFGADVSSVLVGVLVAAAALCGLSLVMFLMLFSGFAQSSAVGLKGIESVRDARQDDGRSP
jgi:hypothetical protein